MDGVRRARLTIVAAVGAAVLGCAACTDTVSGHGTPSRDQIAAPPAFGTCWELRTTDFGSALDQPKRRACGQPHDVETIWVATGALPASSAYPTVAQIEETTGAVATALDDACSVETVDTYLGDDAAVHVPFVTWEPRLPSQEQWAAGARWVRCDIVYGVDEPQLSPGKMSGALKGTHSADFRACYAGTPTDNHVVPCSAAHEAEAVTEALKLPDGVSFPAQARTRQSLAESGCSRELGAVLGTSPRPAGFQLDLYLWSQDGDSGTVSVSCVLVRADGGQSTTAALP